MTRRSGACRTEFQYRALTRFSSAGPSTTTFGEHHDWQVLFPRDLQYEIEFFVVEKTLCACEYREVVDNHSDPGCALAEPHGINSGGAGDDSVCGCIGAQVIYGPALALGRNGELTVVDKRVRVTQIGQVAARSAVAFR